MKLKVCSLIIVLSTFTIIGLLSWSLNRTDDVPELARPDKINNDGVNAKPQRIPSRPDNRKADGRALVPPAVLAEHDADLPTVSDEHVENTESPGLTKEDAQIIAAVVNLSDNDLNAEINRLKAQIEKDDLFTALEEGELAVDKEDEAKNILERYALLGLESTRRKFMSIDPDLRNPLIAHRDSLREIREMLNDDFADEI